MATSSWGGSKRAWCSAALLLLGTLVQAESGHDRSIDAYRNATLRTLRACSASFSASKYTTDRDAHAAYADCMAGANRRVSEQFDAAAAAIIDPDVRAALNRYHATYLRAASAIPPHAGEARPGYAQRQAGNRFALTHAWAMFELAEQMARAPNYAARDR